MGGGAEERADQVWSGMGRRPQTRAAAAQQGCAGGQPVQGERAPSSWWPERAQKVAENPQPTCPRPGGRLSVGYRLLLPGAATWPGYAHTAAHTGLCIGVGSNTAQDIDTQSSRQQCRR